VSDGATRAGLHRTTLAYPANPTALPAGRLVYIHHGPEHPLPVLVLPAKATENRWTFHEKGTPIDDEAWLASLVPLPNQGFYVVRRELNVARGVVIPSRLLVQLAYTAEGTPVIFPAQRAPKNSIRFAPRGVQISDLQLDFIEHQDFLLAASTNDEAGAAATNGSGAGAREDVLAKVRAAVSNAVEEAKAKKNRGDGEDSA